MGYYLYQKIENFPLYQIIPRSRITVRIEGSYESAKMGHIGLQCSPQIQAKEGKGPHECALKAFPLVADRREGREGG
jgi:hypothetical protein